MEKYDVALSFAGEDRKYVEKVAKHLRTRGVKVFYDQFEEVKLWGKDLYTFFSDVYQNQASFTVMFISEAYKEKLWTNHERKSAQARAFSENKEYILPAFFDTNVEVPGVLKTTGYLDLSRLTPEQLADKIIEKLQDAGVLILAEPQFSYSEAALADIDFPIKTNDEVSDVIKALRSYDWYKQNPAIEKIFNLDWSRRTPDEAFILGRNIYQCAVGGEWGAEGIIKNLRRELARLPAEWAEHVLNGMFYEVYFDHNGEFRGTKLKDKFLSELFSIETATKFERSIAFIRYKLLPYRDKLAVLPNKRPEILKVSVRISSKDPLVFTSVKCQGKEQLIKIDENSDESEWPAPDGFRLRNFPRLLRELWNLPENHLEVAYDKDLPDMTKATLPKGKSIGDLRF